MRKIRPSLLLLILIATANLASTVFPNLAKTDIKCDCNNAHQKLSSARSERDHVYKLSDSILPQASHYMGRVTELMQMTCGGAHGDILLQTHGKVSSSAQKAHSLLKEIESLSLGTSESEQFLHKNIKEAAQSLAQLTKGEADHSVACANVKKNVDIHTSFIQHVESHKNILDDRVKHIEGVLARCTSALQKGSSDRDDAMSTDGNISEELKKRLGKDLGDRTGQNGQDTVNNDDVYNILGGSNVSKEDMADRVSSQTLDQLNDAYNSQVAKAAALKLQLDNFKSQGDKYREQINNSNDNGWKTLAQSRLELHSRIELLLQGRYDAEVQRAIYIKLVITIKIKIQLLITLIVQYNNRVSQAANEQEANEALLAGYPLEIKFAALLRQRVEVEQQMKNAISLSISFLIKLIAELRLQVADSGMATLWWNAAQVLQDTEAALALAQNEEANQLTLISVVTDTYNIQLQLLIQIRIKLNAAGLNFNPTQQIQAELENEISIKGTTNFDVNADTSAEIQARLELQIQLLIQIKLLISQAQTPGEISALQDRYNNEFQVAVYLRILLTIQLQIEIALGIAPSQSAVLPESVIGVDTTPEQANNVLLLILFQMKLKLEIKLLISLKLALTAQQNYILVLQANNLPTANAEAQLNQLQVSINYTQNLIIAIKLKIQILLNLILQLNLPNYEQVGAEQLVNYENVIRTSLVNDINASLQVTILSDIKIKLTALIAGTTSFINVVEAVQNEIDTPENMYGVVSFAFDLSLQAEIEAVLADLESKGNDLNATFNFYIQLVIQIRLQLEIALVNLAALQEQNLPTQQAEIKVSQLQVQYNNLYQVVLSLRILIQLQIQISLLQAEVDNLTPGAVVTSTSPVFQLAVLLRVKLVVELRLIAALGNLRGNEVNYLAGVQTPNFSTAVSFQLLLQIHIKIALMVRIQLTLLMGQYNIAPEQLEGETQAQLVQFTLSATITVLTALRDASAPKAQEQEVAELENLYQFYISLAIRIQIQLVLALVNTPDNVELIQTLEAQFVAAKNLALNIRLLIEINIKIQLLLGQSGGTIEGVPGSSPEQQLLVLLTLKLQIQIQIAISLVIVTPEAITPGQGSIPNIFNLIVNLRIQVLLQIQLVLSLIGTTPEAIEEEANANALSLKLSLLVSITLRVNLDLQNELSESEGETPENLYLVQLKLTIELKIRLELALLLVAQLQQAETPDQAALEAAQSQANQLQVQFDIQLSILINLRLIILINLRINLLITQNVIPQELPEGTTPEMALTILINLKIDIYIKLIIALGSLPGSSTSFSPEQITGAVGVSPSQVTLQLLIRIVVTLQIQLSIQLGNLPGSRNEIKVAIQAGMDVIRIALTIQVKILINIDLALQAGSQVPEAVQNEEDTLTNLFNLHLTLAIQIKIRLEIALLKLSQLQEANLPTFEVEQEVNNLQAQFDVQFNILLNIKIVLNINLRISLLIGGNQFPQEALQGEDVSGVPNQLTLVALIQIKINILIKLALALAPTAITVPTSIGEGGLPSTTFNIIVQLLVIIQFQLNVQFGNLVAVKPEFSEAELQAQVNALVVKLTLSITIQVKIQVNIALANLAEGQLPEKEENALINLFNIQLSIAVQIKIKLEIALLLLSQAQSSGSQADIDYAQQQVLNLQAQFDIQIQLLINIKIVLLVNIRINALVPAGQSLGEAIQGEVNGVPAQVTLVALIQIKINILIKIALALAPTSITIPATLEEGVTVNGVSFSIIVNLIVIVKLQFSIQFANLVAIRPESSEVELQAEVDALVVQLTLSITIVAKIQVNIALANFAESQLPEKQQEQYALPNIYNLQLTIAIQIKIRLEIALLKLSQLQEANLPTFQLEQEIDNLQNQFDVQFNLLVNIKLLITINIRISVLLGGNQYPTEALQGEENGVPNQLTLVALIQLKINILIKIALVFAPGTITVPDFIGEGGLPSTNFNIIVQLIVVVKLQFTVQFNNLVAISPGSSESELQAQVNALVATISISLTINVRIQVNIDLGNAAQAQLPEEEQSALPNLYNIHLTLAIQIKIRLEIALLKLSQLQEANLPTGQVEAEISDLEAQFDFQVNILISIKMVLLINIRIDLLINSPDQIAPEELEGGNPQLTLIALIKLKISILINLALSFAPGTITIPDFIGEGGLPSTTFNIIVQLLVVIQLQLKIQLANYISTTPGLSEGEVEDQAQNLVVSLQVQIQITAKIQVYIDLGFEAEAQTPDEEQEDNALPNLYSIHLTLAIQLKIQLQIANLRLKQLQEAVTPDQDQIEEVQEQIVNLQVQLDIQINILINIKIVLMINVKISLLIGSFAPDQIIPGINLEFNVPNQLTLVALIQIKINVLIKIALALAPGSITIPEAIEEGEESLPTASTPFSIIVNLIVIVKLQFSVQFNNLIVSAPTTSRVQLDSDVQALVAQITISITIQAKFQVNIDLANELESITPEEQDEDNALPSLYTLHLTIAIRIRIKLEIALLKLSQAQELNLPEEIESAEKEVSNLQVQFDIQLNILINIKIVLMINIRINLIIGGQAPGQIEGDFISGVPSNLTLVVLLKIKINVLVELALLLSSGNIQVGQELDVTTPFSIVVRILVLVKIQLSIEIANVVSTQPGLSENEIDVQAEAWVVQISIIINLQAKIQVNIDLGDQADAEIPAEEQEDEAIPALYSVYLRLVVEIRIKLEIALAVLAQAQVGGVQAEIEAAQNEVNKLELQYNSAYTIAFYLKLILTINIRINLILAGQAPNQIEGEDFTSGVPAQFTLVALIQLKINILVELALALAPGKITVPDRIDVSPEGEGALSANFRIVVQLIVIVQFQFNIQIGNLLSSRPDLLEDDVRDQAQQFAVTIRLALEIIITIRLNLDLSLEAAEQMPEQQQEDSLPQMYNFYLNIAVQLKIQLNIKLLLIANLQLEADTATPEQRANLLIRLNAAIEETQGLLATFNNVQSIVVSIKILIYINIQINLIASISPDQIDQADESNIPGQTRLVALIQLKIEILIKLAISLSVPGTANFVPEGLEGDENVPSAFSFVINLIVTMRFELAIQFNILVRLTGSSPEAVQADVNALVINIRLEFNVPSMEAQAQIETQAGQPQESQDTPVVFNLKLQLAIQLIIVFQINLRLESGGLSPGQQQELEIQLENEIQLVLSIKALVVIEINIQLYLGQLPAGTTPDQIDVENLSNIPNIQVVFEIYVKLTFLLNLRWVGYAKVANIAQEALELAVNQDTIDRLNRIYLSFSVQVNVLMAVYDNSNAITISIKIFLGSIGVNADKLEGDFTNQISSALRLCIDIDIIIEFEVEAKIQYRAQGEENGEGEIIGSETDVIGATTSVKHGSFLSSRN